MISSARSRPSWTKLASVSRAFGRHGDGAVDEGEARGGEVAELAGGLDDDVDAGPAEVGRGNQAEVADPPARVPHRLDPEQVEDLADGAPSVPMKSVGHRVKATFRGQASWPAAMFVDQGLGQPAPHRPRFPGRASASASMVEELRPVGTASGLTMGSPPGDGLDVAPAEAPHHAVELEIRAVAQSLPVAVDAGDARLQHEKRLGEL